jgi:hypothetical protein
MLQYRPMQAEDVGRCAQIVANNRFLAPRYGDAIAELEKTWLSLLGRLAFTAVVFEESLDSRPVRFVGAGVSAFLSDSFLQDMKKPPLRWVGPEIVRRASLGDSPLLSDKEVAEANTHGGLNLFGWHGATSVEDAARAEVLNAVFSSFIDLHRGFLIKELLGQADSPEVLQSMRNSGGYFYDPGLGTFVPSIPGTADEVVRRPHLMGSTRELALAGTWLSGSAIFSYQAPRFFFSRSEQRLLQAAMQGSTDTELSEQLGISASFVRRCWLSIYDRVARRAPQVLGQAVVTEYESGNTVRGKGKKNRLLAYLREHPEELRPVSRKRATIHSGLL